MLLWQYWKGGKTGYLRNVIPNAPNGSPSKIQQTETACSIEQPIIKNEDKCPLD